MRARAVTWATTGLCTLALAGLAVQAKEPPKTAPKAPATTAKKAPDFTLSDLDGKTHSLKDYKGKILVIEWTNKDCPVWKGKMSELNDTANMYTKKGVMWVHVDSTYAMKEADEKEFMTKNKIMTPVLVDREGKTGHAYGAKTTPHMFIVDKMGNIAYDGDIDDGAKDKTKTVNYVSKALDELLAGKPVTTAKTNPHGCTVKYKPGTGDDAGMGHGMKPHPAKPHNG